MKKSRMTNEQAGQTDKNEALKTELVKTDLIGSCSVCSKDARQCEINGGGKGRVRCAGFVADEQKVAGILGGENNENNANK